MANNQDKLRNFLDQKDINSIEIKELEKELLELDENEESKAQDLNSRLDRLKNEKDDIDQQIEDEIQREGQDIYDEVEQERPSKMSIDRLTQIKEKQRQAYVKEQEKQRKTERRRSPDFFPFILEL